MRRGRRRRKRASTRRREAGKGEQEQDRDKGDGEEVGGGGGTKLSYLSCPFLFFFLEVLCSATSFAFLFSVFTPFFLFLFHLLVIVLNVILIILVLVVSFLIPSVRPAAPGCCIIFSSSSKLLYLKARNGAHWVLRRALGWKRLLFVGCLLHSDIS